MNRATRICGGIVLIIFSTMAVLIIATWAATEVTDWTWYGKLLVPVGCSLLIMFLQSIPARRFYLRRWLDLKYFHDPWIIWTSEEEVDSVTWSIAEYFKYPIHQCPAPSDEKNPAIDEFRCLPNRILHVRSAHIDEQDAWEYIDIYVYYPRMRKPDRMAKSERFELADPDMFDHIEDWLRSQRWHKTHISDIKRAKKCPKQSQSASETATTN